jgi:hypothetical protein
MKDLYKLKNDIRIYLDVNEDLLHMLGCTGVTRLNLPYMYFYRDDISVKSLKFTNYYFYKSFLSFFHYLYIYNIRIYFFKLKFSGLGYRMRRITERLYRFFFRLPNYVYLHIPSGILAMIKRKRVIFYSNNSYRLRILVNKLLLLKQFFPYDPPAFTYRRRIYLLKPGKKPF